MNQTTTPARPVNTTKTAKWLSATYKQETPGRFVRQDGSTTVSDNRVKEEHLNFLPDWFSIERFTGPKTTAQPILPPDVLQGESAQFKIHSEMFRNSFLGTQYGNFPTTSYAGKTTYSFFFVELNGDRATFIVFPYKSASGWLVNFRRGELLRHKLNPFNHDLRTALAAMPRY